jgi:single-stranded-DNA-specific exonuclease
MTQKRSRPLPPPTKSEAAFERALVALVPRPSTTLRYARDDKSDASAFIAGAFLRRDEFLRREPFAGIADAETFHTKIVGVSFEGRQDMLAGLREGAELELVRQPLNEYDPNAIAVRFGDLHVGFLRKEIAREIAPIFDEGRPYGARVASLTGGGEKHRGVNIFVWRKRVAAFDPVAAGSARERLRGDDDALIRALLGDHKPHRAQLDVLERVDAGKNTLAVLGTGRGKSFCFQLTAARRALAHGEKTLVIYPLRALANDQFEAMTRKFDPFGLRVLRANGAISPDERVALFAALEDGSWDVILATPEFLAFHRQAFVGPSVPRLVVVDEAHHLYESKHRAAYGKLGASIASLGSPQVLALTATAGDAAFEHVARELRIEAWVIDPTVRENLAMVDARGTKDKIGYLADLLERSEDGKAIAYCMSRTEAQKVADGLRKRLGDTVMFYHAGMPTEDRLQVERFFRAGEIRVVIATSAFGEGIDLPDVRHVALYHLNFDFTEFNQQAGRAGRDGMPAEIHLLYGDPDKRINEFIIDRDAPTLPVLRELYRGMKGMAHGGELRATFVDISRTLDLDKANERSVGAAVRIFEDAGLVETGFDDEGRYVRFLRVEGTVDLQQNERFAEGEAERDAFARFADLALTAKADALQRIVNRPIYPERVALLKA